MSGEVGPGESAEASAETAKRRNPESTSSSTTRSKMTSVEIEKWRKGSLNPDKWTYVGRTRRADGVQSVWRNPYKVGVDGTRTEVIEKFKTHLVESRLVDRVGELRGKTLLCHCRPEEECHADVLLDALAKLDENTHH